MPRPEPHRRGDYPYFWSISTRWADNDVYSHVNNAIHYQFFDTAVNGWLLEQKILDFGATPTVFLVVETGCTYFDELAFPDTVHAGIRVAHLGRSSVTYEVALFRNSATTAAAQGRFVHVNVGRDSRTPAPICDATRSRLATLQMAAS